MKYRPSESTLSCCGKEVQTLCWVSSIWEHNLLGICRRPSAPQSSSPVSAAGMHLGVAPAQQRKWGPLRDIPKANNPKCPLKRDWGNMKRGGLGTLKKNLLQACRKPLPKKRNNWTNMSQGQCEYVELAFQVRYSFSLWLTWMCIMSMGTYLM